MLDVGESIAGAGFCLYRVTT